MKIVVGAETWDVAMMQISETSPRSNFNSVMERTTISSGIGKLDIMLMYLRRSLFFLSARLA